MKSATISRLVRNFLSGFVVHLYQKLLINSDLCYRRASQHDAIVILTIIVSETLNESLLLFPIFAIYCIAGTKFAVRKCKV